MESPSPMAQPEELLAHLGWARALARRLVGDAAEAEELVQETFVAALRRPPASDRPLRPWLGRVLGNAARTRSRSRARRSARERAAARPEALPSTAELSERAEAQRLLIEELMRLDAPKRELLLLRYFEELEPAEIARRLGQPGGTVRWRLKTAVDELRERLDRRFDGERGAWTLLFAPLLAPRAKAAAGGLSSLVAWSLVMKLAAYVVSAGAALALVLVSLAALGLVDLSWIAAPPRELVQFRPLAPEATLEDAERVASARSSVDPGASSSSSAASASADAPLVARLRLIDPSGAPVEGVELRTSPSVRAEPWRSDADGRAELRFPARLAPFSPRLAMRRAGYANDELELTLRASGAHELGEHVLRPGGALRGRVVDQDGAPLAGAEVWVRGRGIESPSAGGLVMVREGPLGAARAVADADGGFALEGLLVGEHVVRAERDGGLYSGESGRVEIRAGQQTHGLVLVAERARDERLIEGRVLDPRGQPVPRAQLRFRYRSAWGSGSGTRLADDRGRFLLVASSGAPHELEAVDLEHRYGAARLEDVEPGARGLVLRLREPERLELRLVDESGAPVEGGEATALDAREPDRIGAEAERTARAGALSLALPEGPFRLRVAAEGHEAALLGPFDARSVERPLRVVLPRLVGIRGVALTDGRPLAGARVGVQRVCEQRTLVDGFPVISEPISGVEAVSDAQGRFLLTLREAGRISIRAEHAGLAPTELGPFEYDPARGLEGLRLELGEGGALEGRVLPARDEHGLLRDPAGVVVGVSRGDGHARSTRADAEGRYRFEHLQPGRWLVTRLEAELREGERSWSADSGAPIEELPWSCVVREGERTRHDLVPPGVGTCVVRGRFTIDGAPARGWRARLRAEAGPAREETAAALGEDGAYELRAAEPGAYLLSLEPPDGDAPVFLRALELAPGEAALALELVSARIELEGLGREPAEEAPTALYWELDGWRAACSLEPRAGGRVELAPVPAGPGSLRRWSAGAGSDPRAWEVVLRFDLGAGGRGVLRVP